MKLAVIGQGYVGLPLAVRAAVVGFDVTGIDANADRAAALSSGRSHIEDVPSADLIRLVQAGRYRATSDFGAAAGFDYAVITVPTPLREGAPDTSYIEDAALNLAPHVKQGATVVLESTTYPGTTETLLVPLLEAGSGLKAGRDFHVGFSPERIDPGNPTWNLGNTPKVVSGIDDASTRGIADFYARLVDTVVPVPGPKEAELSKLIENTFRHVNIALINELAVYAHEMDIDIHSAIDAAATKPFGFMRFTPGPGVGGHCLPIDPSYLSWQVKRQVGRPFRFVELANDINEQMPYYVRSRLAELLNEHRKPLNGSRVLAIGLAYKKNTADLRESPAIRVVELLVESGASVQAVEPFAEQSPVDSVDLVSLDQVDLDTFDACVVLTDHDDLPWGHLEEATLPILDTRCRLAKGAQRL